ncbi:MAG: DUF523 domain-containing protein [Ruminococcaceae bacterium]|nr:DUF523 domain-containing protein [Oscillospiraceae bacterium]
MILVSACLVGEKCKYNGEDNKNEKIIEFLKDKEYITVCPETMGGLPTPRPPSEIKGDLVFNSEGKDVTSNFLKGAEETLKIAKENSVDLVILKAKSPSCGYGQIYDGSFKGQLIKGNGITCKVLIENGYKVLTEKEF